METHLLVSSATAVTEAFHISLNHVRMRPVGLFLD